MEERKIKRVKFVVDLKFTDFVDKADIPAMCDKIADALRNEVVSGNGFAPETEEGEDDKEALTEEIRVYNEDTKTLTTVSYTPQTSWVITTTTF